MKVVLLQPLFLPWMGMFDMLDQCDLFIFYDDAQFVRQSWQTRNRIKTSFGPKWLSVAIDKRLSPLGCRINEATLSRTSPWRERNLNQIEEAYRKAPFFEQVFPSLSQLLMSNETRLCELNMALTRRLAELLSIKTPFARSSELSVEGKGEEKVVGICRAVGAKVYMDGETGKDLYDPFYFADHGLQLIFHCFRHPVYPQLHGPFVSHLSVVDLLFNTGKEALSVLRSGRVNVEGA